MRKKLKLEDTYRFPGFSPASTVHGESLDGFYQELGEKKSRRIRIAVMDMWKPFRASTKKAAPQAAIVFDKLHVLRHLDKVRWAEYARLSGKERSYIKGQRYTLLSHKENLTRRGHQNLRILLKANSRLHAAYILRESFVVGFRD